MTVINGRLHLNNFPLTMSAVGEQKKKSRLRSIFEQSVTLKKKKKNGHVVFFVEKNKDKKKKHGRRNPAGPGSSINHAAHLEQRRHAPLNSRHQSVGDSALIRPLMMTYYLFIYFYTILYLFIYFGALL